MIRFAPTRIIDIAPLFSGGAPATDRAVAEVLSEHDSFVATGFAGAEGFGGKIADLLSFFSMEETHKLECATCCWWLRKSAAKWRTAICACSDHRCG